MKKPRQIKGRIWLGRLKVTFSRVGAYMGYINFLMLILTFYTVQGYRYASLELFLILAIVGVVIIGMFDYFIMLPSEIAFANEQSAKHQNPIYEEVKDIKRKLEEMKKKITENFICLQTLYLSFIKNVMFCKEDKGGFVN